MNEPELRKLFFIIQNIYNSFVYDDIKVALWKDLLQTTPFERAQQNLRRYALNAENKFPPHPGVLAEEPGQKFEGNYIPNAQETRRMLEEKDRLLLNFGAPSIPESARERMRQLGYQSPRSG